jgi:site-specific DNA-cytosine methylase
MGMRILDLFCGAGGAAMGLHQAGFEVVGVDIKPQVTDGTKQRREGGIMWEAIIAGVVGLTAIALTKLTKPRD